jgi:DNA-binding beta-propeller fold protein YncE
MSARMNRFLVLCMAACTILGRAHAGEPVPLRVESKIPLGDVRGRIDHLALDLTRARLYVAELGNNSVGVVDLKDQKLLVTLSGFDEPQGIAFDSSTDIVFVANGGDGSLRTYSGADWSSKGVVRLGADADNVRIDATAHRAYVGYGNGALAIIDTASLKNVASISLKGHPESFQVDTSGSRVFVNVPDSHEIAVVDRATHKQIESWPMPGLSANFPMAIDESTRTIISVFRQPAMLAFFSMNDGSKIAVHPTCADADDVFVDAKRHLVYVICGEGVVDVFAENDQVYSRVAQVKTVPSFHRNLIGCSLLFAQQRVNLLRSGLSGPAR